MSILCEICKIHVNEEMIKKDDNLTQCYDCLFSMNFNDKYILNGSEGYNLTKYIEISSKYHAKLYDLPCYRLSDNGGCYVCMKLLDIPFEIPKEIPNDTLCDTLTLNKKSKSKINKFYQIESIKNESIQNELNELNIKDNHYYLTEKITLNL